MSEREITYAQAIKEAMSEEMRRDEDVIFLGEDIGLYGGAFGVSVGMLEEFGEERIRETPISEAAIGGAAVGAAITGLRPIMEIMFMDFVTIAMDSIVNQAAKMRYMFGGTAQVPLVVRCPGGSGTGSAGQHAQSLEAWFCHVPGLKVVAPSTPADAKGLLKAAIRDNNPVLFVENKLLYRTKGMVSDEEYIIEIGKADIKKKGKDITVLTYGRMLQRVEEASERLLNEGIDVEIIDLRTLKPLDEKTILESIKKTGRVLICHEAAQTGGVGAEVSAMISESEAFEYLLGPISRVCGKDVTIPYNPELEKAVVPSVDEIEISIRELVTKYNKRNKKMITPLAKRIAEETNVDLGEVAGSGYKGKIIKEDIVNIGAQTTVQVPSRMLSESTFNGVSGEHISLTPMRETVAKRMTDSYFTVPAFTLNAEVDATELINLRKKLKDSIKNATDEKVTITDFITLAVAKTLKKHPKLNSAWCENSIFRYDEINIALAVGMEDGLFVPVIKGVDNMTLNEITIKSKELINKSLNGKLMPSEQEGNTFTISNIGMYGINTSTPILNMPSSAILGVGATNERCLPIDGNVEVRSIMNLSLSADHRVVDGRPACEFLQDLKYLLENPLEILV